MVHSAWILRISDVLFSVATNCLYKLFLDTVTDAVNNAVDNAVENITG